MSVSRAAANTSTGKTCYLTRLGRTLSWCGKGQGRAKNPAGRENASRGLCEGGSCCCVALLARSLVSPRPVRMSANRVTPRSNSPAYLISVRFPTGLLNCPARAAGPVVRSGAERERKRQRARGGEHTISLSSWCIHHRARQRFAS